MNRIPLEIAETTCSYLNSSAQQCTLSELGQVSSLWREAVLKQRYKCISISLPNQLDPSSVFFDLCAKYTHTLTIDFDTNSKSSPNSTHVPRSRAIAQNQSSSRTFDLRNCAPALSPIEDCFLRSFIERWICVKNLILLVDGQLNWPLLFTTIADKLPNIHSIEFLFNKEYDYQNLLSSLKFCLLHKKLSLVDISFKFSRNYTPSNTIFQTNNVSHDLLEVIELNPGILNSVALSGTMISYPVLQQILQSERALQSLWLSKFLGEDIAKLVDVLVSKSNPPYKKIKSNEFVPINAGFTQHSIKSLIMEDVWIYDRDFEFPKLALIFPKVEYFKIDRVIYFEKQPLDSRIQSRFDTDVFMKIFSSQWPSLKKLILPSISDKEAFQITNSCPNLEYLAIINTGNKFSKLTTKGLSAIINSLPNLRVLKAPKPFFKSGASSGIDSLVQGHNRIQLISQIFTRKHIPIISDMLLYLRAVDPKPIHIYKPNTEPLINWPNSKLVHLDLTNWELGVLDLVTLSCCMLNLKFLKISPRFSIYSVLKNNAVHLSELEYLSLLGINVYFPNLHLHFTCDMTTLAESPDDIDTLKSYFYKTIT